MWHAIFDVSGMPKAKQIPGEVQTTLQVARFSTRGAKNGKHGVLSLPWLKSIALAFFPLLGHAKQNASSSACTHKGQKTGIDIVVLERRGRKKRKPDSASKLLMIESHVYFFLKQAEQSVCV